MFFLQIAGKINKIIREMGLKEVGQLEQDLVFGDAGTKDLINFLRVKEVTFFTYFSQNIENGTCWGLMTTIGRMYRVKISCDYWWFMRLSTLRSLRMTKSQNWWRLVLFLNCFAIWWSYIMSDHFCKCGFSVRATAKLLHKLALPCWGQ